MKMADKTTIVVEDQEEIEAILSWLGRSQILKDLKDTEMQERKTIVDLYTNKPGENVEVVFDFVDGDGEDQVARLTIKRGLSDKFKIKKSQYEALSDEAKDCVIIDYKLDKRRFNVLDEDEQKEIQEFITSAPAAPTMSLSVDD
jgi:hypothetical protein